LCRSDPGAENRLLFYLFPARGGALQTICPPVERFVPLDPNKKSTDRSGPLIPPVGDAGIALHHGPNRPEQSAPAFLPPQQVSFRVFSPFRETEPVSALVPEFPVQMRRKYFLHHNILHYITMKATGKFCLDLSDFTVATVKKQGERSTSGSIFVPLSWVDKTVVVLLANKGGVDIECSKESQN
jgi:hypothetical protein